MRIPLPSGSVVCVDLRAISSRPCTAGMSLITECGILAAAKSAAISAVVWRAVTAPISR